MEINAALDFVYSNSEYTTVYLKGPSTYWIDQPVYISANTILEGDSDAVIKLVNNAGWWRKFKPIIGQKGTVFKLVLPDTDIRTGNITIRGFEIDGNRRKQLEPSGHSYYRMIQLQNSFNITIHDMYLHDNLADGIIIEYKTSIPAVSINSSFYNNRIHNNGHDGIYLGNVANFEVYNNIITNNRTDAGVRAQYCNNFKIYNNIIGNDPDRRDSGGPAISIQAKGTSPLNDAEIFNNYLYGNGAYDGIRLWQLKGGGDLNTHGNVYIHHNIISMYLKSGIGIYGFNNTVIENNVLELNGESGITFYEGDPAGNVDGFETIIRNNIIVNNEKYGIDNKLPGIHTFFSSYNSVSGNITGSYNNVTSSTDTFDNPEFAGNDNPYFEQYSNITYHLLSPVWRKANETEQWKGDFGGYSAWMLYHLRSEGGRWNGSEWIKDTVSSPCIDAGDPDSDYSAEPAPNGNRVNIGAFGNTENASKSY